ncbi:MULTISPECIES: hypothetical protein [unclassified Oceanispirochaeta]|nr:MULTISPECIES: hypothetical protein [unclassified Oceanispirochaeta]
MALQNVISFLWFPCSGESSGEDDFFFVVDVVDDLLEGVFWC